MRRSARFRLFRHSPAWLLAIGLFAMAMQAMGGIGLMPRAVAGGGFQVEICTSKGVSKLAVALQSGQSSLPNVPNVPDAGHQDCCSLCAASAPLLLAAAVLGVPPAPTFSGAPRAGSFLPPVAFAWLSHPPRGPPQA
jgi:hypothetical protein